MGHKFFHTGKEPTKRQRNHKSRLQLKKEATMRAHGNWVGRPKWEPSSIKFLVYSMFRAVEKSQRSLDNIRFDLVAKEVHKKFPSSKFNLGHFTWYLSMYKKDSQEAKLLKVLDSHKAA